MVRRILAAALVLIAAAMLLLAAWPQLVGAQMLPVVAQVVSLRAIAGGIAVVLLVVIFLLAVMARPFRRLGASFAVMLLAFIAVTGAVLATRGFGDNTGNAAGDAPDDGITVLAWNTLGDEPGSRVIADLALEQAADVLSLPETTEAVAIEVATIMRDAGRPMWVHHVAFDDVSKARSTSILTSSDLGMYSVDDTRGNTSVVPSVIITPDDGTGPTFIAAHPVAPIIGYMDDWSSDLRWMAEACVGEDVILAGDLNSTIDHYRGLSTEPTTHLGDCVDAAAATGDAAVGTWPTGLPALLGSPIDHVMATENWQATSFSVIRDLDEAGSDHRPIVAHLVPAG
ncbi:endonuclease/exonuclease/phosphatase family protein [Marisediminicola senii]|uniref:endonuclease/exonuclease/phosphatase family protein n=1 Tax=Marisediminicola senii TaxID=2711233 RepID=UPI0013EA124A|nr:endonuclease/exonuclease/phosphatase family protein [Marisediminicola senii]